MMNRLLMILAQSNSSWYRSPVIMKNRLWESHKEMRTPKFKHICIPYLPHMSGSEIFKDYIKDIFYSIKYDLDNYEISTTTKLKNWSVNDIFTQLTFFFEKVIGVFRFSILVLLNINHCAFVRIRGDTTVQIIK